MWSLDRDTRNAMRMNRARQAMSRHDWDDAILEFEELLDDEPDHAEALFQLAESLLEAGDPVLSAHTYSAYLVNNGQDLGALLGLAISSFECCDLVHSVETAREVVRLDPSIAEAHWYLGLALDLLGEHDQEAMGALASARQLEPSEYPWPIELDAAEWDEVVSAGMAASLPGVRAFWANVPVVLLERPDLEELRHQDPPLAPTVTGLFSGELDDDADPQIQRPQAMRLFRRNLALCRSTDEIVAQVTSTIESECMGWLGLLDAEALA